MPTKFDHNLPLFPYFFPLPKPQTCFKVLAKRMTWTSYLRKKTHNDNGDFGGVSVHTKRFCVN